MIRHPLFIISHNFFPTFCLGGILQVLEVEGCLVDRSPWFSCSLSAIFYSTLLYSTLLYSTYLHVTPLKICRYVGNGARFKSQSNGASHHHPSTRFDVMVFCFFLLVFFFPFFPFVRSRCLAASTQFHSGFDNIDLTPRMINVITTSHISLTHFFLLLYPVS